MRVLLASTRGSGHVMPLLPYARALRDAGHEVLLAGPQVLESLAERERLPFLAVRSASPERLGRVRERLAARSGFERVAMAANDLFVRSHARAALRDMLGIVETYRPDAIVRETAECASLIAAEAFGVPCLRVGIALTTTSEDGYLALVADALDELRAEVEVAADPGAERAKQSPVFTLAPPSLDAQPAEVPAIVHRFRADAATVDAHALPDAWWDDPEPPLVAVSFGTAIPTDGHYPGLYRDVLDAVAPLPVRLLVTVGRQADPDELGPLPGNVHVERWVPQAHVMPHATALVAHGGAGTTLGALAAGVPMALLPLSADQPFNAQLVADIGAGLALMGGPPEAAGLGAAVTRLLYDGGFREAAERIATDIAELTPVAEAVDELEAIVADADPVEQPTAIARWPVAR